MMQFSDFSKSDDPANEIFLAALSVVYDKDDGRTEHLDRLSNEARVVYLLWCFDGEVHNGGFDQLFTNSLGNNCQEISNSLLVLNAKNSYRLLSLALSWFPDSNPSKDRVLRYEQYEKFSENAEYQKQIELLDNEFYLYEDNLVSLVNSYVVSNPNAKIET